MLVASKDRLLPVMVDGSCVVGKCVLVPKFRRAEEALVLEDELIVTIV
jgi:hypothetical protein